MTLTDTHCHLDLDKFDSDREAVLERAARAGVVRILIPGLTIASSRAVLKLAESHPVLYAAVGVHPTEAATWTDETVAWNSEHLSSDTLRHLRNLRYLIRLQNSCHRRNWAGLLLGLCSS